MILTVTMNPAIDTAYQLDKLIIDDVNRVSPKKTAGGKGLNVSRVLCQLGDDVVATGLLGGHMGAYMGSLMDADGINHEFTPIAGETRICLNILHEGNQTELLESGPEISAEELASFSAKFAELVAKADCVTISGSLPKAFPPTSTPAWSPMPPSITSPCCSTPRALPWTPPSRPRSSPRS